MNKFAITAAFVTAAFVAPVGIANADTPRWNLIADAGLSTAYIDRDSVAPLGAAKSVWVLRNYAQTIDLGSDPATGALQYPHRSVKIQYAVDCNNGVLAMNAWQMHSGNFADGAVVWADRHHGLLDYIAASIPEEQGAIAAACGTKTASTN